MTDVDPDIWYTFYDVRDETAVTAPYPNYTDNHIHETIFDVFKSDLRMISPCHTYNLTVILYNEAGQGESSQNATESE